VIYDGSSFGTATFSGSDEEADYLGLPGLLDAEQMRALLRERQSRQVSARTAGGEIATPTPPTPAERPAPDAGERLGALRRELNGLVAMHHHRTGKPHGVIHGELRRQCGGPPTAIASADQLTERIAALRRW
jgi:hypothetical protein